MRCLLAVVVLVACGNDPVPDPAVVDARSYTEADRLFRSDPDWLGGDAAFSIPLDDDRCLWLFGDTFVATSDASDRRESEMVRNTLGIQTGRDPVSATMEFVWREDASGSPGPFIVDRGEEWFWPGHGVRLAEGPLLVWWFTLRPSDGGFGFEEGGYRILRVDDPEGDPRSWELVWMDPPELAADPDASVGTAVVRQDDHLVALVNGLGSRHIGWLARFAIADLLAGRADPEWWSRGAWVGTDALGGDRPSTVIDDAGPEASLHRHASGQWMHVLSRGFGATTVAVSTAGSLTGPYTDPANVFTPPESEGPDPFVYAAKAHPWLAAGDGGLLVTYATNSFEFGDLFTPEGQSGLYYPRFVRLQL